ncbi:MAG: ABC transporter permease [Chloroflexi bacterium]|nr:ABC transporter permease [Chloroflexota bacterium]
MLRFRSLPVLALRRMAGNWRLLTSVVIGTLVAAAIISATAIYADAIRDLGLQFALRQRPVIHLDVRVDQSNVNVGADTYQASRARVDRAVDAAIGGVSGGLVREARSATFFPAPAGRRANLADPERDRANLYFRSDIEHHIDAVAGRLPPVLARGADGPIPVAIGEETAQLQGLRLGDRLDLFPFWDEKAPPVRVEIVGLVRVRSLDDRYWTGERELVDARRRSWDTIHMLVPEATFFGSLTERVPTITADYSNVYQVIFTELNSRNAVPIADALSGLERVLSATEIRPRVHTELTEVLRTYDQKLFFTRIPLLVLLLQIGGIVAYYLVMVSTMLIERQAAEIATLRSRGATTAQLLVQYAVEGLILAGLAALTGPPIAAAVISALGPTPAFSALSGGGPLAVTISTASYVLAAVGALIAFSSLMIPAWRATRTTMVEFKRTTARPRPTPLFLRYYLDVALVLVVAIVFWRLSQEQQLFTESLFGETRADPFLLTTPAVFMLTVGIVFLRLFPLALRAVAWLVGLTRSVAVLVGMRSLVRNPTHYTRLILLLMFATGIGMFGATFSATLDQSYRDRAAYAVGGDVRAAELRRLQGVGDDAFLQAIAKVPAEVASPMVRLDGFLESRGSATNVQLLGIDPATFGRVGFFRDDFALTPLPEMLGTLDGNATRLEGIHIPDGTRQVGLWLKAADIRGAIGVGVTLRDRTGRPLNMNFAFPRPGDPATEGWRFFAGDLERPLNRFGTEVREAPLQPPITLHAVFITTSSRIAAQRGVVLFGPLLASPEAPPRGSQPARELESPFPGAKLVHDFSAPAFEVMQGYRRFVVPDQARPERTDVPPGGAASIHYSWLDTSLSPPTRGLRQRTDGQPVAMYLARDAAAALELAPGDTANLSIAGRFATVRIAGLIEYFPTYNRNSSRDSFALVEASRIIAAANASPPDRIVAFNEVWFRTRAPEATRAALAELDAQVITDVVTERLTQQDDPLVAAGWSGILAISFGAVLLLSAIGFVVYSYLTAQERSLEFAILRTLGFSRPQIFAQVVFEHLFVIAAGMGLGTLVGLQIGRYMMDFLATDERGLEVLPPFLLAVSWPGIFLVWGILGMVFVVTIGSVVLLYFRLAVHRALRIGDV